MLDRVKVTPENRASLTAALAEMTGQRKLLISWTHRYPVELTCDDFHVVISGETELDELISALETLLTAEPDPRT